jgi:Uma2 family endonuclease
MNVAAVASVRKLTRREYDRLIEMGWFANERIELIDGILVQMSPQGSRHAEVVTRLTDWLMPSLAGRARVRVQLPFAAADDAEPEPDVAVVPPADYVGGHPERAFLVVEVAESSSLTDRTIKAGLYARAGIPEYWLVDLTLKIVEVYRHPLGGAYTAVMRAGLDATLSPAAFADLHRPVAELLAGV